MEHKIKVLKIGDYIIFIICIVLIILFFIKFKNPLSAKGQVAVVSIENKEHIFKLNIDKVERLYNNMGKYNEVTVKNGEIYISDADCPDLICEKSPPINKGNETIVCIPNKLIITIEGNVKNNNVDTIVD